MILVYQDTILYISYLQSDPSKFLLYSNMLYYSALSDLLQKYLKGAFYQGFINVTVEKVGVLLSTPLYNSLLFSSLLFSSLVYSILFYFAVLFCKLFFRTIFECNVHIFNIWYRNCFMICSSSLRKGSLKNLDIFQMEEGAPT